jgi:hypothetical protein
MPMPSAAATNTAAVEMPDAATPATKAADMTASAKGAMASRKCRRRQHSYHRRNERKFTQHRHFPFACRLPAFLTRTKRRVDSDGLLKMALAPRQCG